MVAGVMTVVILIIGAGGGATKIIAAMTLFVAAVFRLIPSMNRILMAMNTIRVSQEAVDEIHRDLSFADGRTAAREEAAGPNRIPFEHSIRIDDLSFRYPGSSGVAVEHINLEIRKGESVGLAGASGAGKTTLVDLILGLLAPETGRMTVDGEDIVPRMRTWRRQVGYVPQSIYLTDDTIRRNIAFGVADENIDQARVADAVGLARLDEMVASLPDGLDTVIGEHGIRLSGGQRQRIGIARALYRDPELLVLDEATSSLDTETEHEISNAIDALSGHKTLIIVAHRLSTIRRCDRVIFMEKGRLVDSGSFDQLTEANGSFRRLVELSAL
jgi:ABC-type multidrug transport system fused ATPase/permease subunit